MHEVVPELLHIVGDVRTPDGIGENIGNISSKMMNTMQALRRIVALSIANHDKFLVADMKQTPLTSGETATRLHRELRDYAMTRVGPQATWVERVEAFYKFRTPRGVTPFIYHFFDCRLD